MDEDVFASSKQAWAKLLDAIIDYLGYVSFVSGLTVAESVRMDGNWLICEGTKPGKRWLVEVRISDLEVRVYESPVDEWVLVEGAAT